MKTPKCFLAGLILDDANVNKKGVKNRMDCETRKLSVNRRPNQQHQKKTTTKKQGFARKKAPLCRGIVQERCVLNLGASTQDSHFLATIFFSAPPNGLLEQHRCTRLNLTCTQLLTATLAHPNGLPERHWRMQQYILCRWLSRR